MHFIKFDINISDAICFYLNYFPQCILAFIIYFQIYAIIFLWHSLCHNVIDAYLPSSTISTCYIMVRYAGAYKVPALYTDR